MRLEDTLHHRPTGRRHSASIIPSTALQSVSVSLKCRHLREVILSLRELSVSWLHALPFISILLAKHDSESFLKYLFSPESCFSVFTKKVFSTYRQKSLIPHQKWWMENSINKDSVRFKLYTILCNVMTSPTQSQPGDESFLHLMYPHCIQHPQGSHCSQPTHSLKYHSICSKVNLIYLATGLSRRWA